MANVKSQFFIVTNNPDGRVKGFEVINCTSEVDVKTQIAERSLDVDKIHVFAGTHLPVKQQTLILIGEPMKRRGRPPGSKDKVPRSTTRAKIARVAKAKGAGPISARGRKGRKETQAQRNARIERETVSMDARADR